MLIHDNITLYFFSLCFDVEPSSGRNYVLSYVSWSKVTVLNTYNEFRQKINLVTSLQTQQDCVNNRCSPSVVELMSQTQSILTANPPGAAGLSAQSRLASRHVPPVAGQLSGQRLPGGQGEGSRHWESPQTAAEGSDPRPERAGQDPGHHKQPTGRFFFNLYVNV